MDTKLRTPGILVVVMLGLGQAGAAAGPACSYVTATCESLNGQMQQIFSPRADNNYGRVEDFYRIDHNRWLKAEAPRFRPLRVAEPVRSGQDIEAEYKRGQAYASLSERDKWLVLRARDPEDRIWRLASRAVREQVEREAEFFENLRSDLLRRAYMTMTPAHRHQAVAMEDKEEIEEFIRVNAGAFLVVAYQVDLNDILEHLKPASAQPMLFQGS